MNSTDEGERFYDLAREEPDWKYWSDKDKREIPRFRAFLEHPLVHPPISDRTVFKVEIHTSLYGKIDREYR